MMLSMHTAPQSERQMLTGSPAASIAALWFGCIDTKANEQYEVVQV